MNARTIDSFTPTMLSYPSIQTASEPIAPATKHGFVPLNIMLRPNYIPTIESIATGTPENIVKQTDAAKVVANLPNLEKHQGRIDKIYRNTRIETRHLALNLLLEEAIAFSQHSQIQARMQMYQEQAIPLAERVTRQALNAVDWGARGAAAMVDSLRLIVFVSSTGFVAPGVDTELIKRLGLRRDTARATMSFLGCAAAMNGLRIACDHVRANPTHKALVVCLELSSINAVFADEINDVIIHSIFGDGCAAVVVGAVDAEAISPGQVVIRDHLSHLLEDTEDGIVLGIREQGITCQLSRHLPEYIEANLGPAIENYLTSHHLTKEQIDWWAIHPGGTRIIEGAQRALGLSDRQVAYSWEVLRQYGNMLSASILFVMEQMLRPATSDMDTNPGQTGLAFSFSPGIGVEGLLFQKI